MTGVKNKSGGFREGSGRKLKFNEPTKPMRIPLSLVPKVEKLMESLKSKAKK
jgi:DNA polymerase V